ncbi:hypothetical protein [Nocardia sp. NPDC050717]|uniref:DUF7373 family lipoprotein n=1 Tax=Nocardia sp. NPDC050717 TaxID=3157221 RepID=UPI0033F3D40D
MRKLFIGALTTLAVLATACGGNDQEPSESSVDLAALDVGSYPTVPIDVETVRTPASGAAREAIRIGSATPLPLEYDSRFTYFPQQVHGSRVTTAEPPYFRGTGIEAKAFTTEVPGLVAGWRMAATRRPLENAGRGVETFTLRFETADLAKRAAQTLMERAPGDIFPLGDFPESYTKVTTPDTNGGYLRTWMTQGDILLHIAIRDPVSRPYSPADDKEIAKRFLAKQLEKLRSYSPTPLGEIAQLPMDIDGLLSKTVPWTTPLGGGAAVYPVHVATSMMSPHDTMSAALVDAGVDYVALNAAIVARSRDDASAARLFAAYQREIDERPGRVAVEPPPHLPGARCYSPDADPDNQTSSQSVCRVQVGRYVASVTGLEVRDLRQRISAQYKLLATAG